ncbi:MAG: hypothetical protein IT534_08645 [Bauldia sp.]|nr:hypothetical protein [Bauldia sp.]
MARIRKPAAVLAACALMGGTALVQAQEIEAVATAEEIAGVTAALAAIGCELGEATVEKESDTLLEVDDATCSMGQFDIKLDNTFMILSITNDGPVDPAAVHVDATEAEVTAVTAALAVLNCTVGEGGVEKETATLFEVDDAVCEAGQFDIKLDGEFAVLTLTRDE